MNKTSFTSKGEELLFGSKKITVKNWQSPDMPTLEEGLTEEIWVQHMMVPQLDDKVPQTIQELFEVARGSMIYGWFYYPLTTLAMEQLFRIMEAAAIRRCEASGIPTKIKRQNSDEFDRPFSKILNDMLAANVVTAIEYKRWNAARDIRNDRSHPKSLMILMPGQALQTLTTCCELINKLFP
jgi:hypothetical protein